MRNTRSIRWTMFRAAWSPSIIPGQGPDADRADPDFRAINQDQSVRMLVRMVHQDRLWHRHFSSNSRASEALNPTFTPLFQCLSSSVDVPRWRASADPGGVTGTCYALSVAPLETGVPPPGTG